MVMIEHWSWQCNILFNKVSGHNSYIQVRNAICKMTIHCAKGQSNILGDDFYQQRNNSTCDITIQDVRWHINHQGNNSTCNVTIWTWSWQCNIRRHNSTCLWELGIDTAGVAHTWKLDRPRVLFESFSRLFPSLFFLLLLCQPSSLLTLSKGEKDASSILWCMAEQLLTLANTGKF